MKAQTTKPDRAVPKFAPDVALRTIMEREVTLGHHPKAKGLVLRIAFEAICKASPPAKTEPLRREHDVWAERLRGFKCALAAVDATHPRCSWPGCCNRGTPRDEGERAYWLAFCDEHAERRGEYARYFDALYYVRVEEAKIRRAEWQRLNPE